jgi:hypothetical protein
MILLDSNIINDIMIFMKSLAKQLHIYEQGRGLLALCLFFIAG